MTYLRSLKPLLGVTPAHASAAEELPGEVLASLFPLAFTPLCALRPRVPALERAQPSLVCQVTMPWTRPGREGWRASEST